MLSPRMKFALRMALRTYLKLEGHAALEAVRMEEFVDYMIDSGCSHKIPLVVVPAPGGVLVGGIEINHRDMHQELKDRKEEVISYMKTIQRILLEKDKCESAYRSN